MFQNYFTQAELALAAYANLTTTRPDEAALVDAGMSGAQAAQFAANWLVVAQYNAPSGLSATVFERDGQTYLAIRGTEPTDPGDIAADLDVMAGANPLGIPQYQNLRAKVNEWLGNGKLKPGFTVAGHSLGGFLATTLSVEFAPQISHVYLYNAPGFGGTQSRDVGLTPDASLISNIKSVVPFSPIAGLGRQVAPIITIAAENQFSPDIPNPPVSFNHDQGVLTDALAICALYAGLNPDLTVERTNWLLRAASPENARTLEGALDALRKTLLGVHVTDTVVEDRDALYGNLDFLQRSAAYQSLIGSGSLRVLQGANPAELSAGAQDDFGLLVALQYLLPVAIEDAGDLLGTAHADLYAQWLADQGAEPEDRTFTEAWLHDRARMLSAKIAVNTTDSNLASPAYFRDIASNTELGADLFGGSRRTIFGGDGADTIAGGINDDRLYGGGGGDIIGGGMSADYIEGGAGGDRLIGGAGDDELVGGADDDALYGDAEAEDDTGGLFGVGNDHLRGGAGADRLYGGAGRDVLQGGSGDDTLRGGRGAGDYLVGGAGADTYLYTREDGADFIWDEDGEGRIEYDGVTLAGGRGGRGSRLFYDNPEAPDYVYAVDGELSAGPVTLTITRIRGGGHLTVFDFSNGDLGIRLEEEERPGRAPAQPPRPAAPALNPGNANRGDPLVIDLTGTGISTYGLDRNLHFDHDGDRFAERTGWIAAGSGLLVLDADADGVLDDGQELFGDFTQLPGGQLAANGFAALSQYDRNRDGVIDARDPVWQRLRVAVWERAPRGGAVAGDPHEAMGLRRLDELGIAAIPLDSAIVTQTDVNGNTRTRSGQITLADGTTREIAEYRFARDNSETRFLDWRPLPETIAVLPELTLGGVQMDLTQALVRDAQEGWLGNPPGALRAKLDAFLAETDPAAFHARFEALLFAWTGAEAIAEGTHTNQLDARHARVLEQAYGRSFQNPNADQATAWQLTYERLAEGLYASLQAQTRLRKLYDEGFTRKVRVMNDRSWRKSA